MSLITSSSCLGICVVPLVDLFFNDTATTEIYTLSLHDALPISQAGALPHVRDRRARAGGVRHAGALLDHERPVRLRSEEHTSELQSSQYLVCRLLLEKKKKIQPQLRRS